MKHFLFIALLVSVTITANAQSTYYRGSQTTPGSDLIFFFSVDNNVAGEPVKYTLENGVETIAGLCSKKGDSVVFSSPVFNSEIVAMFNNDKTQLHGKWYDKSRVGNYYLPFEAVFVKENVYKPGLIAPVANITGRYDAKFIDGDVIDNTVGIFKQEGNKLSGTFLTTTGDYRMLNGYVSGDDFYLTAFDGSHAFLFKGKILENKTLAGYFYSGIHFQSPFIASLNPQAALPDPKSLTYLKEGYSKIAFSFPDETGKIITLEDDQFKDKVVIILITGSWCPNCMDETSYMREIEEKYKGKPVAIVALSFERQTDATAFAQNINRIKQHFGVHYPFLNAGLPKTASAALPMLNKVMGFPTTIILNKQHEVVEISTGFNGPATGDVFVQYQQSFEQMLDELIAK
jgi:thiol-disulfide isomerase/thioredoxin